MESEQYLKCVKDWSSFSKDFHYEVLCTRDFQEPYIISRQGEKVYLSDLPIDSFPDVSNYYTPTPLGKLHNKTHRDMNVGSSNYAKKKIQPWDIWLEYNLDPWQADIVKRILRTKDGDTKKTDYEKCIHILTELLSQMDNGRRDTVTGKLYD